MALETSRKLDSMEEKQCLQEISTLVLDSNEKVTLKTISNNWDLPNFMAKKILMKWLEENSKNAKNLAKEFVVAGVNSKGIFSITVVDQEKKDALEKKWKKFTSWIFSVEQTKNTRKLDLPNFEPIKVKLIQLNPSAPRELQIPDIPVVVKTEPSTSKKPEPAKSKTPFSIMKPTEVKKEVVKAKSPEKPVEVKVENPEKSSPEEAKPAAKAAPGKKGQIKNQKPVGKGISSFFTAKPGSSKNSADPPKITPAPANPPISPKSDEPKAAKRPATPEEPPSASDSKKKTSKPAAKKIKLKEKANKRSRIRVMEDSSEEEAEEQNEPDEPVSKFIKFDREFTPDRNSSPEKSAKSPEPVEKSPEPKHEATKGKRKAKRYVKKRFTTEDGFMRTETVLEEYSASEGENDENKKKNSPPKPVEKKTLSEKKKASPEKEKKKAPQKATQSSKITSFFTRK